MNDVVAGHGMVGQTIEHLRAIGEQAVEGIAIADLNGIVQFVNAEWARMHGYDTPHELVGGHIKLFHTEEQMRIDVEPLIEEAISRGMLAGPTDHVRRDGTVFPTLTKVFHLKTPADISLGLIIFATDKTNDKQAEDHFKQHTEELSAVNEQLRQELTEGQEAKERLENQKAEAGQLNERLQQQITEHNEAEGRSEREIAELTEANEQLQQEAEDHSQAKVRLEREAARHGEGTAREPKR